MEAIISRYAGAANSFVISPSDQAQIVGKGDKFVKRLLHDDQPNYLVIPLFLETPHAILVVVLVQPLLWSSWPGSVFFAVAIEETYVCCKDVDVVSIVGERVGELIDRHYPQITVDVPKVPWKALSILFPIFQ